MLDAAEQTEALRDWLSRDRVNLRELGRRTGLHHQYLWQFKTGRRKGLKAVTLETLLRARREAERHPIPKRVARGAQ